MGGAEMTPNRENGVPTKRPNTPEVSAEELARIMQLFVEPGQVVELRALHVQGYGRPHVEAGFFDSEHLLHMAKVALGVTDSARGVYFTLNPLNRDLLARRCNRIAKADEGELSKDKHVRARRWLLVDADPVRDPLVSATDSEKAAAQDTILDVRSYLQSKCWPDPILADSGNGFHLLYRVDLPSDDGRVVERVLQALAARFDNDHCKIDKSVFNPSRICKMPGTLARKGDNVPTRPHRRSQILEVPGR
jgi:hypothetical protein